MCNSIRLRERSTRSARRERSDRYGDRRRFSRSGQYDADQRFWTRPTLADALVIVNEMGPRAAGELRAALRALNPTAPMLEGRFALADQRGAPILGDGAGDVFRPPRRASAGLTTIT
jgi:hypothetical protein